MVKHDGEHRLGFSFSWFFPTKPSSGVIPLFFIIFLIVLLAAGRASAAGVPFFISADVSEYKSGEPLPADAVSIFDVEGELYLFIPSGWDCGRLRILSEDGASLRIDGKTYQSGDVVSVRHEMTVDMGLKENSLAVSVVQSSVVPAVFITTDSGFTFDIFSSKENREAGACKILNADASVEYDGRLEYIRIRGQSTTSYPKKSFQIKLSKSAALYGMEKEKKWILLANYADKSLIRNTVALDLARYAGVYAFVPETKPVDVFLNHRYYGSFLLTEKCEIDPDRLDITDLESMTESLNPADEYPAFGNEDYEPGLNRSLLLEKNPEDITGGYLVLMTIRSYYIKNPSGFITSRGQCFTLKQPKNASLEEVTYIQDQFQTIEDALFSSDPDDQTWTQYLDETTFVHRYVQAEVTADNDGDVPYFYKDADRKDPKIYCGPVWDQDNIWGVNTQRTDPAVYYIATDRRSSAWFPAVIRQHPDFRRKVLQAYQEVYEPALRILLGEAKDPQGILRSLTEYGDEIAGSAALDNIRWRIASHRPVGFNLTGDTPAENIAFLQDYIAKRKSFLDGRWLNRPQSSQTEK